MTALFYKPGRLCVEINGKGVRVEPVNGEACLFIGDTFVLAETQVNTPLKDVLHEITQSLLRQEDVVFEYSYADHDVLIKTTHIESSQPENPLIEIARELRTCRYLLEQRPLVDVVTGTPGTVKQRHLLDSLKGYFDFLKVRSKGFFSKD